jgi:hypothetical protein
VWEELPERPKAEPPPAPPQPEPALTKSTEGTLLLLLRKETFPFEQGHFCIFVQALAFFSSGCYDLPNLRIHHRSKP